MNKTLNNVRITIAILLLTGAGNFINAQKFKVNQLYYKVINSNPLEVAVVPQYESGNNYWDSNEKPTGDISIPKEVEHKGKKYSVTKIAKFTFIHCKHLTNVTIPNSVKTIKIGAFYNCKYLNSITIGNSVNNIEESAFKKCSSLKAINIPNSVPYIDKSTFEDCSSLESITIPNSIKAIGNSLFYGCSNLMKIDSKIENVNTVSMGMYVFSSVNTNKCKLYVPAGKIEAYQEASQWKEFQNIIDKEGAVTKFKVNQLYYKVINSNPLEVAVVPQYESGNNYWDSNEKPTGDISIPKEVEHKGKKYSVTKIAKFTFIHCKHLTNVTIPNSVKTIKIGAFYNCKYLNSITIGNSVNNIEESAFKKCSSLKAINIPNSVPYIDKSTFEDCSSLESITIGNSVKNIGNYAFLNCSKLSSINIPNSVTNIKEGVFKNCSSLKSITIPNSIKAIGNSLFYGCSNLMKIDSKIENVNTVSMGMYVFSSVNTNKCKLYVPNGTKDKYKKTDQWKEFYNIEENNFSTSIADVNNKSFSIYPTYVKTGFTIELKNDTKINILDIYSLSGKKVYSVELTNNKQNIDVSNLQQGIYIVKVNNKTIKFIKQ